MPGIYPPPPPRRKIVPPDPAGGGPPGGETSGAGPVGEDVMPYSIPAAPSVPPPGGGTTSGGGGGYPGGGGGGGGPTTSSAPANAGKDPLVQAGFSQAYANELYDLMNQWEQISGFAQPITTDELIAMAKQHVVGMGEFARYVWNNFLGGGKSSTGDPHGQPFAQGGAGALSAIQQQMPWLQFGMDAETYHSRLSQLASDWQRYTGEVLNPTDGSLGQQWVEAQLGGVTPGLAAPSIVDDPAIQKAFGWVRYGLTYRDFSLKKEQMSDAFGTQLTNDQAVTQLHYFHAAQGAASQARATQRQAGQQAQTGVVSTGEVR